MKGKEGKSFRDKHARNKSRNKSKLMDYSNEKAPIVTKRRKIIDSTHEGDDEGEDKVGCTSETNQNGIFNPIVSRKQPQQAQGMSRAAKKRLKKQKKTCAATASPSSSFSASVNTQQKASNATFDIRNDIDDDDERADGARNDANDDNLNSFYDSLDKVEDGRDDYDDIEYEREDETGESDEDSEEEYNESADVIEEAQSDDHSLPEWVLNLFVDKIINFDLLSTILSLEEVSDITSQLRASYVMKWILAMDTGDFYQSVWGKLPCHYRGGKDNTDPTRFSRLFSRNAINKILNDHLDIYGVDVELLLYNDESDRTLNRLAANGREVSSGDDNFTTGSVVSAKKLWEKHDKTGAILSLLCPQKYDDIIWKMNSALEHEFGSLVLGQVLMFPTKGDSCIPPQYRKFDSFILQIEGNCKVDIYKPLSVEKREDNPGTVHVLDELLEDPYMSIIMTAGDVLYIPIGWGYGQCCEDGEGCIQYCITTNIMNSTIDILELLLPQALSIINEKAEGTAMKCLPSNFGSIMGVSASENNTMSDSNISARSNMIKNVHTLLQAVSRHAMGCLDAACDQHTKKFIMNRLPAPLSHSEESRTFTGTKDLKIFPFTKLRIVRPGIARVLLEDGVVVVYHCMDNSREQSTDSNADIRPLEYDVDDGPAIEMLLQAYPQGVEVSALPHPSEELDDKIGVAQSLFCEGILYVEDEATLPFKHKGCNGNMSEDDEDCPF